jgi:hypothetical protein
MGKFGMPLVAVSADSDDLIFEEIQNIAGMGTVTFKACPLFYLGVFIFIIRGIA